MYVLRLCCQKAQQQNLGIVIVDVEFQYDRKKLTVYYYCNGRIDFRGFVKELYSIFYARIWMENIKNRGIGDKGWCVCNKHETKHRIKHHKAVLITHRYSRIRHIWGSF